MCSARQPVADLQPGCCLFLGDGGVTGGRRRRRRPGGGGGHLLPAPGQGRGAPWPVIVGLGLLAGGALSNLADRFFRHHHGAVVDFIQLVSWWATFNVADAAITVGALTLAVSLVLFPGTASPSSRGRPPGRRRRPRPEPLR